MSQTVCNPGVDRWQRLNEQTDEQLARALLDGQQEALAVLFDRYHRLVYSVALPIVRDPGEAEEVVQTVFLDCFRALARFDSRRGRLKVWLLQYAYHRAMNRKRDLAAQRFYQWVDLEGAAEEPALRWNPAETAEAARWMEQLFGKLSARRREILQMTYVEGLTAEEIAVKLGQSVNAVRHDLYRGLALLRGLIVAEKRAVAQATAGEGKEFLKANAQAI